MQLAGPIVNSAAEWNETAAMEKCRAGDPRSFELIVQKYMKPAYFSALAIVGNHEDALDLSQEAFAKAFRARHKFDHKQKFFTWYYKILRNVCLNHLRDRRYEQNRGSFDSHSKYEQVASEVIDRNPDPAGSAEAADLNRHLWSALNQLDAEEREILILREMEGCSYQDIAERLEIPCGTVMSRLFYARRRLKQLLESII